jgi:hypothetical protein
MLCLLTASLTWAPHAFAQTATTTSEQPQSLEEVTVTGSRIKRTSDFTTADTHHGIRRHPDGKPGHRQRRRRAEPDPVEHFECHADEHRQFELLQRAPTSPICAA